MSSRTKSRATLRDAIADRLREDIITGALRPGAQVRDLELAERYGASSSPVREAIVQVAGERLIRSEGRRVKFVAPFDKRTTAELFEMVRLLSVHAYRVAIPRMNETVLGELRANLERQREALAEGDRRALARLSWSFRDPVLTLAGNREIQRTVRECYAWMQRLTVMLTMDLEDQVSRYALLLAAMERRDVGGSLEIYTAWADHFAAIIDALPDF